MIAHLNDESSALAQIRYDRLVAGVVAINQTAVEVVDAYGFAMNIVDMDIVLYDFHHSLSHAHGRSQARGRRTDAERFELTVSRYFIALVLYTLASMLHGSHLAADPEQREA